MGLKESQFARVVGYAAQRPKIPADRLHPSNRRITISMRFTEQAASTLKGANVTKTESRPQKRAQPQTPAAKPDTNGDGTLVKDEAPAVKP
jgi:hypothetical protein